MPLETEPFDAVDYLTDSDSMSYFLQSALEEGDAQSIALALDTVVRAHGFARLASDSGIPYHDLVRSLNVDNRTNLDSLIKVLDALGVKAASRNAA